MLLHAPLLVPSDAAARGKINRELPQAAPSAAAPRTGVREEEQPHQRGDLASDGPHLQLPTGAVVLLHAPLLVPSDAAARENPGSCSRPRPVPLHQEPLGDRAG